MEHVREDSMEAAVSSDLLEVQRSTYTPGFLKLYSLMLSFSANVFWQCPLGALNAHYNRYMSKNHIDVGVGTGNLIARALKGRSESEQQRIAIMDLNQTCLDNARQRLMPFNPERYIGNVLAPLDETIPKFDSASFNWVMHCLPGTFREKGVAIGHITQLLNPGGVLFGSTILGKDVYRPWRTRFFMNRLQTRGMFCNQQDDLASLEEVLPEYLDDPVVRLEGCVALFTGKKKADTEVGL